MFPLPLRGSCTGRPAPEHGFADTTFTQLERRKGGWPDGDP